LNGMLIARKTKLSFARTTESIGYAVQVRVTIIVGTFSIM